MRLQGDIISKTASTGSSYSILTVRDLKERLQLLPDDMSVLLSRDSEGNGYSYLYECSADYVIDPDDPSDVFDPIEDKESIEEYYPNATEKVFVLWPV